MFVEHTQCVQHTTTTPDLLPLTCKFIQLLKLVSVYFSSSISPKFTVYIRLFAWLITWIQLPNHSLHKFNGFFVVAVARILFHTIQLKFGDFNIGGHCMCVIQTDIVIVCDCHSMRLPYKAPYIRAIYNTMVYFKARVTMMYIRALYIYKYILQYTSILDNDQCLIYYW